jgi:hypothetical protein
VSVYLSRYLSIHPSRTLTGKAFSTNGGIDGQAGGAHQMPPADWLRVCCVCAGHPSIYPTWQTALSTTSGWMSCRQGTRRPLTGRRTSRCAAARRMVSTAAQPPATWGIRTATQPPSATAATSPAAASRQRLTAVSRRRLTVAPWTMIHALPEEAQRRAALPVAHRRRPAAGRRTDQAAAEQSAGGAGGRQDAADRSLLPAPPRH